MLAWNQNILKYYLKIEIANVVKIIPYLSKASCFNCVFLSVPVTLEVSSLFVFKL